MLQKFLECKLLIIIFFWKRIKCIHTNKQVAVHNKYLFYNNTCLTQYSIPIIAYISSFISTGILFYKHAKLFIRKTLDKKFLRSHRCKFLSNCGQKWKYELRPRMKKVDLKVFYMCMKYFVEQTSLCKYNKN